MSDFDFLARLDEWLVHDEDCAAAYEQTGPMHRSWLKKSIARTFTLVGGLPQPSSQVEKIWPDGFTVHTCSKPCDWVCVCLGADFVSPVQLCAALVPALVAGVKKLVVLRDENGSSFPASLLAACELSGAETVYQLPFSVLSELLQTHQGAGDSGRILTFGQGPWADWRSRFQDILFWQAPSSLRMGIVFAENRNWETAALNWGHPAQSFSFWGQPPTDTLLELKLATSTPEDFRGDALFSPAPLSGRSVLELAPGHELSWYWPELTFSFFLATRTALSTAPCP